MTPKCRLRALERHYGNYHAVNSVEFDVEDGEFVVLLGPSGCGKTTTLRMIAGLEKPTSGEIEVAGRLVSAPASKIHIKPEHRDIGMVFQSYAIWPHMTVFDNVAYPLRARKVPRAEIGGKVERALDVVGLHDFAGRSAVALSGGQMQRVALARALVYDPALLLFDEPLSNLDLKLREKLRLELKVLQRETGLTSIYVTHDQAEAVELADKVIVMKSGKIMQIGAPRELYRAPESRFVAEFISTANVFEGYVADILNGGRVKLETAGGRTLVAQSFGGWRKGDPVDIVIHPEDCRLVTDDTCDAVAHLSLTQRYFQGTSTRYRLAWGGDLFDVMALGTAHEVEEGSNVTLAISPSNIRVLRREGGA